MGIIMRRSGYVRNDGLYYDDERLAAIEWSYIAEGADQLAYELVNEFGYAQALEKIEKNSEDLKEKYSNHLSHLHTLQLKLAKLRSDRASGERLQALKRLGVSVLIPTDDFWPLRLNDLGSRAPLALWVRGEPEIMRCVFDRSHSSSPGAPVALVGSRAASARGQQIARDFSYDLASSYVIVSGGAFGIDAAAHRGAICAKGVTVIFSAAGVDRIYPASHADLYHKVWNGSGLVVSESPFGGTAQAHRFLLRNRLIAAFSRATIVVEAPMRSGALSTARSALELGRPVGAVPAAIDYVQGVGCNELIRNGGTLVACVKHIRELIEPIGVQMSVPIPVRLRKQTDQATMHQGVHKENTDHDFFAPPPSDRGSFGQKVFDAVPKRYGATVESIAANLGKDVEHVRVELAKLALRGSVQQRSGRWVKTPKVCT